MNIAHSNIKRLAVISTMAIITACGGGGGGGGGDTTPATPTTPTTPTLPTPPVATGSVTRTAAGCSIAQKLGGFTDSSLEIKDATWLQVVGQKVDDSAAAVADKTLLAAGKEARIRIDVTAAAAGTALPTDAKLQLAVTSGGATICEEFTLTSASAAAPTSVDYRTLDKSYVATIPVDKLKEGSISYQIIVHAADSAAAPKLYKQGSVTVSPAITDKVVIYPISFDGQTGSLPSTAEIKRLILRTMPHADVTITVAPAVTLATLTTTNGVNRGSYYEFAGDKMRDALNDLVTKCAAEYPAPMLNECGEIDPTSGPWQQRNKSEKCFGIYPSNVRFDHAGLAQLANRALLTPSFSATDNLSVSGPYSSHWLTSGARTLVHEYGHVLGLGHAKCGTTEYVDNWGGVYRLYDNGRLGPVAMGFDTRDGVTPYYFADSTTGTEFADMMSYCGKEWASDRGYRAIIDYIGYYDGGPL